MQGERTNYYARAVQEYVQEHLHEKITVQEMARVLNLHPSYLNTIYKNKTGESVTGFIGRKKVERAQHLLMHSEKSLAEICALLGFFDQSHFTRTFKRICGMTPGKYRQDYLPNSSNERKE